jgi:hypothetical protein
MKHGGTGYDDAYFSDSHRQGILDYRRKFNRFTHLGSYWRCLLTSCAVTILWSTQGFHLGCAWHTIYAKIFFVISAALICIPLNWRGQQGNFRNAGIRLGWWLKCSGVDFLKLKGFGRYSEYGCYRGSRWSFSWSNFQRSHLQKVEVIADSGTFNWTTRLGRMFTGLLL